MPSPLGDRDVPLDRDRFTRTLIGHLAETLQDVIGVEEASGLISIVGQRLGNEIDHEYRLALATERLTPEQVGEVLVDLKARIQGDFFVIEQDEDRIVLGNRACPFGEKVLGRPALCMMTSNVFGSITAENLGYARVDIEQSIAQGHGHCRVVVWLRRETAPEGPGREYFGREP